MRFQFSEVLCKLFTIFLRAAYAMFYWAWGLFYLLKIAAQLAALKHLNPKPIAAPVCAAANAMPVRSVRRWDINGCASNKAKKDLILPI
jgi:hypothetical protein